MARPRIRVIIGAAKLDGLHPHFRPWIDWLLYFADEQGVTVEVISGYRTIEDQKRAAAQARAAGRPAAAPGRSAHNFGLAVDLAAGGHSSSAEHKWLQEVWKAMGGYFYPKDAPHFEHPDWKLVRDHLR